MKEPGIVIDGRWRRERGGGGLGETVRERSEPDSSSIDEKIKRQSNAEDVQLGCNDIERHRS